MLRKLICVTLCTVILFAACDRKEETLYKVVKVKDGDTMELLSPDHQNITVRLAEIDCPEKSQAYGQAAKQYTASLCFGKQVKLLENNKDRYGRTVGQVFLEDGTNVNYQIVKNGYAWQYRAYSKSMELAMLEQQARQNHLGLWQDPHPTPPWNFRRSERSVRSDSTGYTKPKRHYKKRRKHYEPPLPL